MSEATDEKYIVVGKNGAVIRSGLELETELVLEIPRGEVCSVVEKAATAKGKPRLRLLAPAAGWVSAAALKPVAELGRSLCQKLVTRDLASVPTEIRKISDELDADGDGRLLPVFQALRAHEAPGKIATIFADLVERIVATPETEDKV